jgi:hypothetical protein
MSKKLDPHFLGWSRRHGGRKPRRLLTRYWTDLIAAIERRRFPGWCATGILLLNVALQDQRDFEAAFKKVQQNVRLRSSDPSHENQVHLMNGPPQRRDAIVGIALGIMSREARDEALRDAAGRALEDSGARRALVLCVQVGPGIRQYPYGTAAVFFAADHE